MAHVSRLLCRKKLDLGQFERFKRVFATPWFGPLLGHTSSTVVSRLPLTENIWRARLLVQHGRDGTEEAIFEMTLMRVRRSTCCCAAAASSGAKVQCTVPGRGKASVLQAVMCSALLHADVTCGFSAPCRQGVVLRKIPVGRNVALCRISMACTLACG